MSSLFRVAVARNMDPKLRGVAVLVTPLEVGVQFSLLEMAALLDTAKAVGARFARNAAVLEAVPGAYAVFSATMPAKKVGPFLLAVMDDQKVWAAT